MLSLFLFNCWKADFRTVAVLRLSLTGIRSVIAKQKMAASLRVVRGYFSLWHLHLARGRGNLVFNINISDAKFSNLAPLKQIILCLVFNHLSGPMIKTACPGSLTYQSLLHLR